MIDRRAALLGMIATVSGPTLSMGQSSKMDSVMKFNVRFSNHEMTGTLYDNPSSREFFAMLPLELKIEDYSTNEKITYLPRKLTQIRDVPFDNERPGDIAYYAPWGDVVFFYNDYKYSRGLIRLGRFENGFEPLFTRGEYPLRMDAI